MSHQNLYMSDSILPFYFDEQPTQDSFYRIIDRDGNVAGIMFNYHDFIFEIKQDHEGGGHYLYVDSDQYSDGTIRLIGGKYIINLNAFKCNAEITFTNCFEPIMIQYSKKLIKTIKQCNRFLINS